MSRHASYNVITNFHDVFHLFAEADARYFREETIIKILNFILKLVSFTTGFICVRSLARCYNKSLDWAQQSNPFECQDHQ